MGFPVLGLFAHSPSVRQTRREGQGKGRPDRFHAIQRPGRVTVRVGHGLGSRWAPKGRVWGSQGGGLVGCGPARSPNLNLDQCWSGISTEFSSLTVVQDATGRQATISTEFRDLNHASDWLRRRQGTRSGVNLNSMNTRSRVTWMFWTSWNPVIWHLGGAIEHAIWFGPPWRYNIVPCHGAIM